MPRKLTAILIFILFLLPFVSWYYLQSGLNWRKKAQAIMNGTTPMPSGSIYQWNGTKPAESIFDHHVSLVSLISCDSAKVEMELITKLYTQFKGTGKANFIFVDTCSGFDLMLPDSLQRLSYLMTCPDSLHDCQALLSGWPAGKHFALVDRKGIIRSHYATNTKDEKRLLVEHMALLIPRDNSEEVELKRGSGNQ